MDSMAQGVQRYSRTKMVLPLRVWVGQPADESAGLQLAHTVDISPIGGRLGGLRTELLPGQTITLQRGQSKASFRVIWNRQLGPGENQAGIEALESQSNIWGVDLPGPAARGGSPERLPKGGNSGFRDEPSPRPNSAAPPMMHLPAIFESKRMQWGVCLGSLLVSGLLALAVYQDIAGSVRMMVRWPVPGPPTAAELAAMAPKPQSTVLAHEITTWHARPVPRLNVEGAPTERMVYPVSPDMSLSGRVDLDVVIATDGRVKQVRVLSGERPLAQAAEQAARQWRYSPLQLKGEPAEGETNVVIAFRGADAVSLEFPSPDGGQARKN
jgi:TonB family protein